MQIEVVKCHLRKKTGFEDWFKGWWYEDKIFLIEIIFETLEADKDS